MSGQYLKDVKEEKDLGVLVDQELKFHRQTAAAVKKASSSLGLVKKTFASLDEKRSRYSLNHLSDHISSMEM